MKLVFADTSYWLGLLHPKDPLHSKTKIVSAQLGNTRIVTTEMVLTEVLNALGKHIQLRDGVVKAIKSICNHPNTEVIPQTSIQFHHAIDLYHQRLDKEWGLTDCASMAVMHQRGITEALTHDHDFEQMGFTALLR